MSLTVVYLSPALCFDGVSETIEEVTVVVAEAVVAVDADAVAEIRTSGSL